MLKKLLQVSAAISLVLISTSTVFAKATPETVVEVLKLTGLTDAVGDYPKNFKTGIDQAFERDQQTSQEIKDALYTATENTIKPSVILLDISKSILGVMEESELNEIIEWYESDLGKKIAQEEKLANTPEALKIIARDKKALLDQFQRAGFARNIEKLYSKAEFTNLFAIEVAMASRTAAAASGSLGDIIDPEQFRDPESANQLKARPALKESIVASYIYSHRNIDLRDLIKYEMFLSADATIKFNRLVLRAVGDSFNNAFKQWSEKVQVSLDEISS